ncbi:MAG: hypothetical protein CME66_12490 [Halobacteriovoraceae bacterium]|jgi:uncharacterized protein (DUF58 family)|nr:hypothetical protein [Halobacteriovoraceae bacterium]MAX67747.1 hypothetical protein [Halobacteriovoraceae bacterium]
MDLKEIEKVVGSIQSHLFRNSNSFSVGMLKSHFKGAGIQFKEHQVYNPGDDVRFIDWKLSAKTNTTFVKTFEEERNVEIYILIDVSDTMLMGYKGISKLQASIELACLVYLLAEKSKDKVSVLIHTDSTKILPLSSGQEGIVLLISQLQKMNILNKDGKINFSYVAKFEDDERKKMSVLKSLVAKGKEVIILSDFSRIKDVETLNKLLYRPNMHCFIMESPLDNTDRLPFSIFGVRNGKDIVTRVNRLKKDKLFKGRYKKISVKERYLEKFVREML